MTHARALALAAAAGLATHALAFTAGRRSAPVRVETRTVTVDRTVTVQAEQHEQQHTEVTTSGTETRERIVYRTGPVQVREVWRDREVTSGRADTARAATTTAVATEHVAAAERIVVAPPAARRDRWSIEATGDWGLRLSEVPRAVRVTVGRELLPHVALVAGTSVPIPLGAPGVVAGVRVSW